MQRMPQLPPLSCRICIPHVGFFVYEEFRKHLRLRHGKKKLSAGEFRQYENYPNAFQQVRRGPPSARRTARSNGVHPSAAQNQNNNGAANPPPAQSSNNNGVAQLQADQGPANGAPSNQPSAATPPPSVDGPVHSATPAANQKSASSAAAPSAVEDKNSAVNKKSVPVPVNHDTTETAPPVSNLAEMQEMVEESVQAHIAAELKARLPLLGNEIAVRVRHEVDAAIVGFIKAAQMYSEDCDSSMTPSQPSITQHAESYVKNRVFVSDGLNVHISFKNDSLPHISHVNSVDDINATLSDEELLCVSSSLLDGSNLEGVSNANTVNEQVFIRSR